MPSSPGVGLSLDDPALDGGKQRLAVREQQADVLRPRRRFLECGDLVGTAGSAIRCFPHRAMHPHVRDLAHPRGQVRLQRAS